MTLSAARKTHVFVFFSTMTLATCLLPLGVKGILLAMAVLFGWCQIGGS